LLKEKRTYSKAEKGIAWNPEKGGPRHRRQNSSLDSKTLTARPQGKEKQKRRLLILGGRLAQKEKGLLDAGKKKRKTRFVVGGGAC